ncbi:hypothetical protein [Sinorhizobium fredii]|uniref:hypothetical protein n=1 Tax=Rhizobium fredii TaxID=380 RepID=UPI0035130319
MSEREDFYDAEIAPALADLAKRCRERGLSFVASVEFDRGDSGSTVSLADGHGWLIETVAVAARSNHNVDLIIGHIHRKAREVGHSSLYLSVFDRDDKFNAQA